MMAKSPVRTTRENGGSKTVLPTSIPPHILNLLQSTLQTKNIKEGFLWILKRMGEGETAIDATDEFLEQYERRIMKLSDQVLAGHPELFRAALLYRCVQILPYFRVRFAEAGYNSLFLQTWLQKRMVAYALGITQQDIEMKIRVSSRTPLVFLRRQIEEITPHTFLPALQI